MKIGTRVDMENLVSNLERFITYRLPATDVEVCHERYYSGSSKVFLNNNWISTIRQTGAIVTDGLTVTRTGEIAQ